jgi:3-isopropylmalate/(R)-2-methylmalate dehydratase large subunit
MTPRYLAEIGKVLPGALISGADSHTCTAGALNASGIGFGSTDLAAAMAMGELRAAVPPSIRVDLYGAPDCFVTGKDIILEVIRRIEADGALDASIEIGGVGLGKLNVDERFAIANMLVEAGATTCVLECDDRVMSYVTDHGVAAIDLVVADADASYLTRHVIDLRGLEPTVAVPPSPAAGEPISPVTGIRVDQVYIGNCANGTLTDLRQAASILRGRKVAQGVRMFVVPATQSIYLAASAEGLLATIVEAGAAILPPNCGACFGGHMGILAAGETAVTTMNRNFRGRMGHPDAQVFLANAWVAAAAAVAGEIIHPASLPAVRQ